MIGGGKYVVERLLGAGWEGEVYRVIDQRTGAPRAMKLFFDQRNVRDRAVNSYARKLEKLRGCRLIIHYHHAETLRIRRRQVSALISEFVEGVLLRKYVRSHFGRRLPLFEALHILYGLAGGLVEIHERGEYHGDLHPENILIRRRGVHFDLKVIDFYDQPGAKRDNMREDVLDVIKLFHAMLGGKSTYADQPPEVKAICKGLKRSLVVRQFPSAAHLVRYLDQFEWPSAAMPLRGLRERTAWQEDSQVAVTRLKRV